MKRKQQALRDAKQLFRLCLVNDLLDQARVRHVVQLVIDTGNRHRFDILAQFRRLARLDCVRHSAKVESVTPLSPGFQADIHAKLLQIYGPGLNVSFATNPALIGGMRIAAGSDVYDGSVRAKLAALEASFKSATN
jgi:F-type H+-transporting ATPase subunit delta